MPSRRDQDVDGWRQYPLWLKRHWMTLIALLIVSASLVYPHFVGNVAADPKGILNSVSWYGWPFVYLHEYPPVIATTNPYPEVDRLLTFIISHVLDFIIAIILLGAVAIVFERLHREHGRSRFCFHLGFLFMFVTTAALMPTWFQNNHLAGLGYLPWIVRTTIGFSIFCFLYAFLWLTPLFVIQVIRSFFGNLS